VDAGARAGRAPRFEAAVAGVVPVVRVLRESLAGAHVERIHGIVNGTTNFILSEMARTGAGYDEALAQAQELGYAEADPTDDVGGADAAAKMAILARLAFGVAVSFDDVRYDGITHLTGVDIAYARELGLSLKLIGTAERVGDGISVRVHPAFLPSAHPLASVGGSFNAMDRRVGGDHRDHDVGARGGRSQTASAVLGDVVAAVMGAPPMPGRTPHPDRRGRGLAVLCAHGGRRRAGRARADRRRLRRRRRVDQVGGAARDR